MLPVKPDYTQCEFQMKMLSDNKKQLGAQISPERDLDLGETALVHPVSRAVSQNTRTGYITVDGNPFLFFGSTRH